MDIESLKEVANLISSLGTDAKEGFLWYLAFTCLRTIVVGSITLVGLAMLVRFLKFLTVSTMAGCRIHHAAGFHGEWTNDEVEHVCSLVKKK